MISINETNILLCRKALEEYDFKYSDISFIRHSENLTFKIIGTDQSYLLRIHTPLSGLTDTKWQNEKSINSELLWLKALNENQTVKVQNPIVNKTGKLVTTIIHEEKELFCTLLTWLDGVVRYESKEYNFTQAENLGSLLAKLDNHAVNWQIPENFSRPTHGFSRVKTSFEKLKNKNPELQIFDLKAEEMIQKAIAKIEKCYVSEYEQSNWGLIHADLCENNYLLNGDDVSPIDFSLCGFGSLSYDLPGSIMHIFNAEV